MPGRGTAIGLERNGELVAGVLYEDYNGANLLMHVASDGSAQWMTPGYLRVCFEYPFGKLGCKRVTGIVPSINRRALMFDERLGFKVEARLTDAHPDGDLIVLSMKRDECRWIRSNHG